MSLRLDTIRFRPDGLGAGGNPLPLRIDGARTVAVPEWQRGRSGTPADSPVAFSLADLRGEPVVHVELSLQIPGLGAVQVLALPVGAPGSALRPSWLPHPQLLWPAGTWFRSLAEYQTYLAYSEYFQRWQAQASANEGGDVLGVVAPRWVVMGADGRSGPVAFTTSGNRLALRGVGVDDVWWTWLWRASELAPWLPFAVTGHRVYRVLARPTAPWSRVPQGPFDHEVVWTRVLDHACKWADGTRSAQEAATAVTHAIFEQGDFIPATLQYGCPIGAFTSYQVGNDFEYFDCDAFLDRLEGGIGRGPFLNCTDCATAVASFSNALGCDLWQSRMGTIVVPFATNPIRAIGSREFQSPCGWGLGFSYHEVAWTGQCTADDHVYDACLEVLSEPQGADPIPLLPAHMRFGYSGDGAYRDKLAAPGHRDACVPTPATRIRRRILPMGSL
jgi:hypothetical protein